ncbi:hypothetical protein DICPUDRAFT_48119 [Dictyostelium purpureum]|uniref:Uncharacterized protein n=1 Tax=Dictyostelium purpureum TaxID=5786 RepID=F0ZMX6_DICPU|nr:uncharacterized protein DICPUDRAFT_48119 [Dictyostelium purpureum]EGC34684.1 hypothetical protein DICPUDRAFT_48119 [Dictyostelium purpureum]|eukprot:XP_003288769.1 hypothetical protein DICPUDRAFT_48119 [Dictyostelium purpureum]
MTLSTLLFIGEPIFLVDQHLTLIEPISKRIYSDNIIKNANRIGQLNQSVLEIELENGTKILIKPNYHIQITECCTYRFGTSHQYGILTGKIPFEDNKILQANNNNSKITFEIKISPHIMTNLLAAANNSMLNNDINQSIISQQNTKTDIKKEIRMNEKNSDKISSSISIIDLKSEQLQQTMANSNRENQNQNNLFEYFIKPGQYELTKCRNSNSFEIESKHKNYSIEYDYVSNKVTIKSNNSFLGNSCQMDIEEFNNTYEVVIYNTYGIQTINHDNCEDFIKIKSKSNDREKIIKNINDCKELFKKELTINKENIELFDSIISDFCKTKDISTDIIVKKNPFLMEPLYEISKLYESINLIKTPQEILHQMLYEYHYQILLGKRVHDPLTHLARKMDIFNSTILHIDSILKESKETILLFGNYENCKRKVISFLKDNINQSNSASTTSSSSLNSSSGSISSGKFHYQHGFHNNLSIQENFSTHGFHIINSPFKKWSIFKCPTFNEIRNDINSSQSIDYIVERARQIKCLLIAIPFKDFFVDNGNKVIETIESFKERFPFTFDRSNHPESQQQVQLIITGIESSSIAASNLPNTSVKLKLEHRIKQLTEQLTKTKEILSNNPNSKSKDYQLCSCLKKENFFLQILEMEKNNQIHYFEASVFKRIPLLKSIDSASPFSSVQYKSTMNNSIMQHRLYQSLEIFALTWTNILSKFLHSEQLIYEQECNNYNIHLEIEKVKNKLQKSNNELFELRQREAIHKKNLRELLRIRENASNQNAEIKNDICKRAHDKCKERVYALKGELQNTSNNPLDCSLIFIQHIGNGANGADSIKQYIEGEIKRIENDEYEKELEDCIKYETKKLMKRKTEIKNEEIVVEDLSKKQIDLEKQILLNLDSIQLIKNKKKSLEFVLLTKNVKNSVLVEKIITGLSNFNLSYTNNSNNNFNIFINQTSVNNQNIDDHNIVVTFLESIDISDTDSMYSINSSMNNLSFSGSSVSTNSSSGHHNYASIGSISKEKNIFKTYLQTHNQYQLVVKDKKNNN